jgi:membrane protein
MLVAAAWIAVATHDKDIPILEQTEAERIAAEHRALLLAAQVRLRTARAARADAPWYRVWRADFAVREAEEELERVEESAPAPLPPPPRIAKQAKRAKPAEPVRSPDEDDRVGGDR